MLETIVRSIRFGPFAPVYESYSLSKWENKGRPSPPPYTLKRLIIREFAWRYGCRTLVETGTFRGDTIWTLRYDFDQLYSIELDTALYDAAVRRFADEPRVRLVHGDRGEKLKEVVDQIKTRTLFWLDGHYCGDGTGMGAEEAPVMREMRTVFDHPNKGHIILLDDARCFTGRAGYPTVQDLRAWVVARRPDWVCEVVHDVIRIYPKD